MITYTTVFKKGGKANELGITANGYTSDIITHETIKVVNDNLLSSINTMNESTKIVQQKRAEAFLAIKQLDSELKQIQSK